MIENFAVLLIFSLLLCGLDRSPMMIWVQTTRLLEYPVA